MKNKKKVYAPTREKGRKNLKKTGDGRLKNQHGVVFTEEEKRDLQNAVKRVNRKRDKMLRELASKPRLTAGKPSGHTLSQTLIMGKEPDTIVAKRTASLQRFTSRKQFEDYMEGIAKIERDEYVDERMLLYKENHITALRNVYGEDADDVIKRIDEMGLHDYYDLVTKDEMLEIGYIDSQGPSHGSLNEIRKALNLPPRDVAD